MGSIRGFRCEQCRTELLAAPDPARREHREEWVPRISCCGQPLKRLPPDQLASADLLPRRAARCPRCGYEVGLVVRPAGSLVCMVCRTDFVIGEGHPDRDDQDTPLMDQTPPDWP
jgi:DNA-directed RNA polymerase subunit RPC12/RpoP